MMIRIINTVDEALSLFSLSYLENNEARRPCVEEEFDSLETDRVANKTLEELEEPTKVHLAGRHRHTCSKTPQKTYQKEFILIFLPYKMCRLLINP